MPVSIENNTARPICLFPTDSFPRGRKLVPGLNRVDDLYWEEFMGHRVMTEAKPGRKSVERFPGKEQIAELQLPVQIVTPNGVTIGPMITMYETDQVGREEGPPPPQSLKGLKEDQAMVLIKVTTDRVALKRWASERSDWSSAAATKLAGSAP